MVPLLETLPSILLHKLNYAACYVTTGVRTRTNSDSDDNVLKPTRYHENCPDNDVLCNDVC